MATGLATTNGTGKAEAYELALVSGDLTKLNTQERLSYYNNVCQSLGLNPLTKPFEYLTLNGKLLLYARKDCTDQLRRINNVSVTITDRQMVQDVYVVTARATLPNGRTDESTGVVTMGNLKGDALANALMKAESKAKRRVTLSICGLGMLDETEVETIPESSKRPALPDNGSGHGSGAYASPEQEAAYTKWITEAIDFGVSQWLDAWTGADGTIPPEAQDALTAPVGGDWNRVAIQRHLVTWAIREGHLDPAIVPEEAKARQNPKYLAILHAKGNGTLKALKGELRAFMDDACIRARERLLKLRPDLAADDGDDIPVGRDAGDDGDE